MSMEITKNTFKAAIAQGRQQIGIWCMIGDAGHAEALATCGFDWMLIDTEHTAITLPMVQAMLQAAAPYPTHCIVRPGSLDPVEIKRLLDIGAQSLLIPMVNSADEARRAVAATRYAPEGMRGYAGMTRATRFGTVTDYTRRAADEICVLVQIESVAALAAIEEIAAVPGVDGLFIGPADLAATMGHADATSHPEVQAAVVDAIDRIRRSGKPAGILTLAPGFLEAAYQAGTVFTAVAIDQALMVQAARDLAAQWTSRS
jgi:4-hydroxy-2-oxoheptanedioate aldolase